MIFSPVMSGKGIDPVNGRACCSDQHRHLVVPAGEPGHRLDPARLPARLARARSPRREPEAEERYTELEVRALTGAGSEKAVVH